jgi:hypothetical protein
MRCRIDTFAHRYAYTTNEMGIRGRPGPILSISAIEKQIGQQSPISAIEKQGAQCPPPLQGAAPLVAPSYSTWPFWDGAVTVAPPHRMRILCRNGCYMYPSAFYTLWLIGSQIGGTGGAHIMCVEYQHHPAPTDNDQHQPNPVPSPLHPRSVPLAPSLPPIYQLS